MHTDAVSNEDSPLNNYLAKVIGVCFEQQINPYNKVKTYF